MTRFLKAMLVMGIFILGFSTLSFSQENITITTYYPSPFGSYKELETEILYFAETVNGLVAFNYPDATYDRRLRITAGLSDTGNNDQGASIDLHGNVHALFPGRLDLVAGRGSALTFWSSPAATNVMERMRIDNAGNVGIGIVNPGYRLQVQKTAAGPALMIGGALPGQPRLQTYGLDANANAWMGLGTDMGGSSYEHSIYFPTTGPGRLTIGDYNGAAYNTRMTILQSGNVGIGANPVNRLDVEGAAAIGATYSGTNAAPANGLLVEGNVGIGTASPNVPLSINGNAYIINGSLGFNRRPDNGAVPTGGNAAGGRYQITPLAAQWQFETYNSGGANTGVIVIPAATGNVGIGVVPAEKLQVQTTTVNQMAIRGISSGGYGVWGESTAQHGVCGVSQNAIGVYARSFNGPYAIYGASNIGYGAYILSGDRGMRGTGVTSGVEGYGDTWGVYGNSSGSAGVASGVAGVGGRQGVYGQSLTTSGNGGTGVYGVGDVFCFYANTALGGAAYGTSSSGRWKKNIKVIDRPLEKVLKLRGVYFDWDKAHGGRHSMGMIGEEVGKIVPEVVQYEKNGIYTSGMDYGHLTPILVEAIKEQQKQIESLKSDIELLKEKVAKK